MLVLWSAYKATTLMIRVQIQLKLIYIFFCEMSLEKIKQIKKRQVMEPY